MSPRNLKYGGTDDGDTVEQTPPQPAGNVVAAVAPAKRDRLLDVLAALFGISAWISINGTFVQLPLMVQVLPEGWAIASYISVIVQAANVGPVSYSLLRWLFPRLPTPAFIYPLLALGTAASLLLALFWDETTVVYGVEHSTALFVLVFFLAFVDCTSSILFMPFMAVFRSIYLNSYLIGEGLSGFLPATFALIQGVGGNPHCQNVTNANGDYESSAVYPQPRFSVEVFFFILMAMMLTSSLAFFLLHNLKTFDSEKVLLEGRPAKDTTKQPLVVDAAHPQHVYGGDRYASTFALLLAVQTFACFVSNGALPSIQTYSCLPYGNLVYHLSVTLSAMANPLMAFTAFFLPCRSLAVILGLISTGIVFVGFIVATALYSPGMLAGQDVGGVLTVASWIIYGGLFSYVKVSIAGWCRLRSDGGLFWFGVWTQVGSALGSVLGYVLVNHVHLFEQYYVTC